MNIESGWYFHSADFSLQASNNSKTGTVMFVRDVEGRNKWHRISKEIKGSDNCPKMYIVGTGETIEEAIADANLAAANEGCINILQMKTVDILCEVPNVNNST